MAVEIENVTEALQRFLGLQQAQSFNADDLAADAIARLLERRGDVSRLIELWESDAAKSVVADFKSDEHGPVFASFQRIADASMVIKHARSGLPQSFRPLAPELITSRQADKTYRQLGRSVVEGLWRPEHNQELCVNLSERIESWRGKHPLAELLRTFCVETKTSEISKEQANLVWAEGKDSNLHKWVATIVLEDWEAWLKATTKLPADEQADTMRALISLHLHVALLWRLRDLGAPSIAPFYFAAMCGSRQAHACNRAAYNCFIFWRDRSEDALYAVAEQEILKAADQEGQDPHFKSALVANNWIEPLMWTGASVRPRNVKIGQKLSRQFVARLTELVKEREMRNLAPRPAEVKETIVQALRDTFATSSGPAVKTKEYFRITGRAAGIVGPEGAPRKRYQLDDTALGLLARLHAARPDESIRSNDEERASVGAMLDDIFERYGIIITLHRDGIQERIKKADNSQVLKRIRLSFPADDAVNENRELFDRRLDELRLVRRYSDDSAVVHFS